MIFIASASSCELHKIVQICTFRIQKQHHLKEQKPEFILVYLSQYHALRFILQGLLLFMFEGEIQILGKTQYNDKNCIHATSL